MVGKTNMPNTTQVIRQDEIVDALNYNLGKVGERDSETMQPDFAWLFAEQNSKHYDGGNDCIYTRWNTPCTSVLVDYSLYVSGGDESLSLAVILMKNA